MIILLLETYLIVLEQRNLRQHSFFSFLYLSKIFDLLISVELLFNSFGSSSIPVDWPDKLGMILFYFFLLIFDFLD